MREFNAAQEEKTGEISELKLYITTLKNESTNSNEQNVRKNFINNNDYY